MPLANLLESLPELVGCGSSRGRGDIRANISFTRMETISMEERQFDDNGPDSSARRRVPTLRDSWRTNKTTVSTLVGGAAAGPMHRYFPLLCVAQSILIGIMVIYLYWFQQHDRQLPVPADQSRPANSVSKYRVYSGAGLKARFLVDSAAADCNQRKHDLHHGSIRCQSSNVSGCATIPSSPSDQEDFEWFTPSGHRRVQIVTTSKAGKRLHTKWLALEEAESDCEETGSCRADTRTKVHVHPADRRQSIIGWGGAMTDSSINNILGLSTNGTNRLLDDYFGPDGLQFNIVRVTIGGSDFSARFYTNNDKQTAQEADDLSMSRFQLTTEDTLYKIPLLRLIQERYAEKQPAGIKLFASMWSPPTWMKTNNHFNKGQLKGSISASHSNQTDERYYKALSELKRKFLLAYRENSVHFWGLTVMNEPVFAMQPFLDFNTMIFPKHDYAAYVAKYLGPTLKGHPALNHIKLMAHDDNRRFLLDFTEPTLNNPASGRYIDGVSVHGYADKDYHQMETLYELNKHRELFVLPTELCSGHLPWMQKALAGNWHRGIHYALDIIHSLQHSAAGWVDWNMALDMEGGPGWLGGRLDSPVLVDKARDLYHKSPMFYVLGHFSRYIPAGSQRVGHTLLNGIYNYPLETVTFSTGTPKRPNEMVTVVLNANPHPVVIHLRISYPETGVFRNSDMYKVECDADSITTIRYRSQQASDATLK